MTLSQSESIRLNFSGKSMIYEIPYLLFENNDKIQKIHLKYPIKICFYSFFSSLWKNQKSLLTQFQNIKRYSMLFTLMQKRQNKKNKNVGIAMWLRHKMAILLNKLIKKFLFSLMPQRLL